MVFRELSLNISLVLLTLIFMQNVVDAVSIDTLITESL